MDLRVCCKRLECRACAPRLEKPQKYDARCVKKDYKQRIVLGAQKVNEMAVSADAKGRNVKTFYVGQRLVRIRIEPKSAAKMQTISPPIAGEQEPKGRKEALSEQKPVALVIAEEIKIEPEEVRAMPTEARLLRHYRLWRQRLKSKQPQLWSARHATRRSTFRLTPRKECARTAAQNCFSRTSSRSRKRRRGPASCSGKRKVRHSQRRNNWCAYLMDKRFKQP